MTLDESFAGEFDESADGCVGVNVLDAVDELRVNHPLRAPKPTNALPISKKMMATIDSVRCWFPPRRAGGAGGVGAAPYTGCCGRGGGGGAVALAHDGAGSSAGARKYSKSAGGSGSGGGSGTEGASSAPGTGDGGSASSLSGIT
ncbi:MAG: hypothetical protein ABW211_06640 [Acidimicrobiia bacterium]